jgi:hypothetical protein
MSKGKDRNRGLTYSEVDTKTKFSGRPKPGNISTRINEAIGQRPRSDFVQGCVHLQPKVFGRRQCKGVGSVTIQMDVELGLGFGVEANIHARIGST